MIQDTCDYPNCPHTATKFIAGTSPGDINPSQWCEKHYEEKPAGYDWIRKFQKGELGLPKNTRGNVYAW